MFQSFHLVPSLTALGNVSLPAEIAGQEQARERARQLLNEYEEPKLEPAKNEELLDFIARREREIPAADALNQTA